MMDYAGARRAAPTPSRNCCGSMPASTAEIALREKDFGVWRAFTWNEYQARVRDFALGLVELGPASAATSSASSATTGRTGSRREIAAHAVGAMSLGLYRDVLDEEAAYLLNYGEARSCSPRTRSRSTSCSSLADVCPTCSHIIYSDPRGMRKYDDPRLMARKSSPRWAATRAAREPGLYDRLVDATKGEDVAILCTTSGTTSHPKLAMLAAGARAAPLRDLSRLRSQGAGRRIRLRAAAALDHGAGLRARQRPAVPDEGQLRRRARHDDERFPRDRADLRAVRAARLGIDRRRRARPGDGRLAAQAAPLRLRHEDRPGGARRRASVRSSPTHCCSARCATASASPACARRRPAARRSGPTPSSSSGHGRAAAHALRPDRTVRAPTRCIPRARSIPTRPACRWPTSIEIRIEMPDSQRRRRDRGAPSQHVPRLLQEPGSLRRRHQGRLDAFGRCRLFQRQQASSSSSTASRISPRPRAASASRRNTSRTS